jgi:hypothetical protein
MPIGAEPREEPFRRSRRWLVVPAVVLVLVGVTVFVPAVQPLRLRIGGGLLWVRAARPSDPGSALGSGLRYSVRRTFFSTSLRHVPAVRRSAPYQLTTSHRLMVGAWEYRIDWRSDSRGP